jgi:hypothetical protein
MLANTGQEFRSPATVKGLSAWNFRGGDPLFFHFYGKPIITGQFFESHL